jgi:AhpD family alkylhydroperoxidase
MSKRIDYNQVVPAGVKALGGVYGYVLQSSLPPELLEPVYLRVSQINNCAYSRHAHAGSAEERAEEREARAGAGPGSRTSVRRARAGRPGLAETVTRVAEIGVPDDAYAAARSVFEERELVDLTIAISLMNAYNRMAISFRNTPQAALEK